MDDATRVDAERAAIVGEVVDRAEREAVAYRGDAPFLAVVDDVRRLKQRALS